MTAETKTLLNDVLDETLLNCVGKTTAEMSVYELKKWARQHEDGWEATIDAFAATSGASDEQIRAQLVANAYTRVGDRYSQDLRHSPGYADCSSLIQWIYEETIPQAKKDGSFNTDSAGQGMFCHNKAVLVSESALKPGDLIFWALKRKENPDFRKDQMGISHVGMVVEANGGSYKVIEARPDATHTEIDPVTGEKKKVIDDVRGVVIENKIRNRSCLVFCASPVRLYTGEVIREIPATIKNLDTYGILSDTEYVEDKPLLEGEKYVYHYCSCSICRSSSNADMTGQPREEGMMAIPAVDQITYVGAKETEASIGEETGTIMTVDGKIYKCADYGEGRFALDLDTVGLYITDNEGCYSCKLIWSDRVTHDGIDPDESFINDHLAAINATYEHQITTSANSYAVRSIDPDSLVPKEFVTYRNSGSYENNYIMTGGQ